MLELIHRYVETLDKYFGNVCELDLIFNFQKAYFILNELVLCGELCESSKRTILRVVSQQDEIEQQENSERGWGDINLDGVAKSALLSVQEFKQSFTR
ncbi:AP-1 complex subunit sigma-2 [Smittium culicis]|uniref:AP-1 complex subunit sigma-2 n=1 Tax=Smittium culicis TaxID=133412 RepID=A0A1R1YDT1_9FUNG|nr:AP-1 complex subunit sigma-2 [Smittium culicis]